MIQVEVDKRISIYIFFIRLLYSTLQWMSRSVVKQMNIEPSIVLQKGGPSVVSAYVTFTLYLFLFLSVLQIGCHQPAHQEKLQMAKLFKTCIAPATPTMPSRPCLHALRRVAKCQKDALVCFFPRHWEDWWEEVDQGSVAGSRLRLPRFPLMPRN